MKTFVQTSIAVVFVFLFFSCKKETSVEKKKNPIQIWKKQIGF